MTVAPAERSRTNAMFDEIRAVADQIADLVRSLAASDVPIPGWTWSITEAALHLAKANEHMAAIAIGHKPPRHGDGTRAGLAAANEQLFVNFTERDNQVLAGEISRQAAVFVEAAAKRPDTDLVDTPLGEMPMSTLGGYILGHMLMHGQAMADALGRPPLVQTKHVEMTMEFMTAVMPRLLNRTAVAGLDACYELRIRGIGRFLAIFADGGLTIAEPGTHRVDCVISAEPVAFFLISMGLRRQGSMIARGRLIAYGRKPWLGTKFVGLFEFP